MKKPYFSYIFCFLTFASLLSSCQSNQADHSGKTYPIVAVDASGDTIRLTKPAQRVVSLVPAALDALYMLHADSAIVGIPNRIYTDPNVYPYFSKIDVRIKEKLIPTPTITESGLSMETIIKLNPDLVIIPSNNTDAIQMLKELGIAVFGISTQNFGELNLEVLNLGILLGKEARAKELIAFSQDKIQDLKELNKDITNKKTIYYAWSGGRIYSTTGRKGLINDCFEMAGLENACPYEIDAPNISPETLISWNPDIMLLWNTPESVLYDKKELSSLDALKEKRVFNLSPPFLYDPHTLKIVLASIAIHHYSYPTAAANNLSVEQLEILSALYGPEKAKLILQ
ncbi:ABC transporter substrate-binding protein [Pedobacter sp. PLR]|uniref:ABC transporter substrate-binding protein n=1 Tax=Pedobacter sp. PLR TaxID=2994465 RepID=UPI0022466C90|nr:ABC transporter substrate-binding protein [Pedobacter sp. PLR]MCX2454235.1 ABC transporter substrate-binding protein [Pedobacter sp. PLR]